MSLGSRVLVTGAIAVLLASSTLGATIASGVPSAGTSVRVVSSDDDIPGVPIGSSPVTGSLDAEGDHDDVFSIVASAGAVLSVTVTGSANTDFDLFLFGPGATGVSADEPVAMSEQAYYPEAVSHTVSVPGTYYVNVLAGSGVGEYVLTYTLRRASLLTCGVSSSAPAWGSTVRFTGVLRSGSAVATGAAVTIERSSDGVRWASVGEATTTASGYAVGIAAPTSRAFFRARFAGDDGMMPAVSSRRLVVPQVYLTPPSVPSSVRRSAAFMASGLLMPRHAAGSSPVTVICERREVGKWVVRQRFAARVANAAGASRYVVASVRLSAAGAWRVRAYHRADALTASTYSAYRSITVR